MDHYQKLSKQVRRYLLAILLLGNLIVGAIILVGLAIYEFSVVSVLAVSLTAGIAYSAALAYAASVYVLQPIKFLWQAILHIAPDSPNTPAPDTNKLKLGHELVTSLAMQVYQYASQTDSKDLAEHRNKVVQAANIVSHLPLPLFVFNKDQLVTNASDSSMEYCGLESSQLFGKPLYDNVHLEFPSENTLESWIREVQNSRVTARAYWERVRIRLPDESLRQCDMAAYYNRDSPSGTEFIITMFDRTKQYTSDDQSLSFVALAVHELRTPLTMLKGYIEVFEDELMDKLNDEQKTFLKKMDVSAKQLAVFVNNILNVTKVDENQLTLQLTEADWASTLKAVCSDAEQRARINGKKVVYKIGEGLPSAAIDRVSIYEVMNNLLDNAIKYSGKGKEIIVSSKLNKEGLIETSVEDFGLGIPGNILPHLFEKFSRSHRTRSQIPGSGLGLYICKAMVGAHGGNIWVNSEEGGGSTFSFTLLPYSKLADEQKQTGEKDIVRSAHGWIKNHSLYRR
jgi:signal transduction histidine kinase